MYFGSSDFGFSPSPHVSALFLAQKLGCVLRRFVGVQDLDGAQKLPVSAGLKLGRGHGALVLREQGRNILSQRNLDLRGNAFMPEGLAVGREPFLNRQQQSGAVGQIELSEHRSGAKGRFADQFRAASIPQRAGDDFARSRTLD